MKRFIIPLPLIYILISTLTSCSPKNRLCEGSVWGTTYHISYRCALDLNDSIQSVMDGIDREFSMFRPSSTVSRLNSGENPELSDDFIRLFRLAKYVSSLSHGAYDITVAPLTDLWGFGRKRQADGYIPTGEEVDSVLRTVGIDGCSIDGNRMARKHPSTSFDFSSVAKGYGVDAIAAMLVRNGARDFIIEIGGEIVTAGVNPRGSEWRVQIDAPTSGDTGHEALYIIPLSGRAVATSGNYRNYRTVGDVRFGHTLDPRTGRPAESPTLSATVIAPDCATADALATACMAIEPDSALALADRLPGIEVLIAVSRADSFDIATSQGFPEPLSCN